MNENNEKFVCFINERRQFKCRSQRNSFPIRKVSNENNKTVFAIYLTIEEKYWKAMHLKEEYGKKI